MKRRKLDEKIEEFREILNCIVRFYLGLKSKQETLEDTVESLDLMIQVTTIRKRLKTNGPFVECWRRS